MIIGYIEPFVGLLKDLATITFYSVGCWAALSGLRTWKSQLVGETKYELFRKLIKASYRVQEKIKSVRSSHYSVFPNFAGIKQQTDFLKETIDELELNVVEIKELLFELNLSSQNLDDKAYRDLIELSNIFKSNVLAYLLLTSEDFIRNVNVNDKEGRLDRVSKVVFSKDNGKDRDRDNDEFGKELDEVVEQIEAVSSKYLKI